MASSLKSLYPNLARVLGESESALYAKQRSFAFSGLLGSTPGRGPGSGVHATRRAVAQLLVGLMLDAGKPENVPFAKSIADAISPDPDANGMPFLDTLAALLGDKTFAARVLEIRASASGVAEILYRDAKTVRFLARVRKSDGIRYGASIGGTEIAALAAIVADLPEDE